MADLKNTVVFGKLNVTDKVVADKIVKLGGTANEVLCADGSTTTLSGLGAGTVTSVGVANGGGLSVSGSPITSSGTITISHADTSSQGSMTTGGRTYVNKISLDGYGHVTSISTGTETVTSYSLPLAANGTRGGIQIGYSSTENNRAVSLSSEKAYISLPSRLNDYKQTAENSPSTSGWYFFNDTSNTSAVAAFGSYAQAATWVSAYSNNWAAQLGVSYYSNGIAFRRKSNSTSWSEWIPIATQDWVKGLGYVTVDTGMTSVTVSGSGNAVTSASYSSSTRQLTLTKGSTFMPSTPTSVELNSGGGLPGYGGFIDFHYHDNSGNPKDSSGNIVSGGVDYSSRIIEDSPGRININSVGFKSGSVTASKFVKSGSSDSYVLLGGGGTKALSEIGGGGGDVYGPSSSTDNAIARFDGTTGKIVQNSGVIIDDNNKLKINATDTGGQSNVFQALSTSASDNSSNWIGRSLMGSKTLTFLMGTYKNMAGVGAHSWTDANTGSGSAWAPMYFQPDGGASAAIYMGQNGNGWTANTGTLIVKGSATVNAGTVDVNGTLTATTIKKTGSSNNYVLLGGGGTKALSEIGGGGGDVYGPASSTDHAIVRFNGTTGKSIQNSGATIDDNGYLTASRLTVYANNNGVTIGSQNSSFCHIYNSASIPFIFNNAVAVTGDNDLGTTSYKWGNLYLSGSLSDGTNSVAIANIVTTNTAQTISGKKTFTNGMKVSGRYIDSGDDEGIVIGRASNNYAGLCLGDPGGVRSVFYLLPGNQALWKLNNGTGIYDIYHPGKSGTIALTSDIPALPAIQVVSSLPSSPDSNTLYFITG